jgi:hypothetical protein
MLARERILTAVTAAGWNVTAAAAQLGVPPTTLAYQLRAMGIERPASPIAPIERHPPAAALTVELARLRRHARLLLSNYLPTPARAVMIRENELAQRAILLKLRDALGRWRTLCGSTPAAPAVPNMDRGGRYRTW